MYVRSFEWMGCSDGCEEIRQGERERSTLFLARTYTYTHAYLKYLTHTYIYIYTHAPFFNIYTHAPFFIFLNKPTDCGAPRVARGAGGARPRPHAARARAIGVPVRRIHMLYVSV